MNDPTAIQHDLLMCVQMGNIDAVRMFIIDEGANINHVWGGGSSEIAPGATALGLAISSMRMNTNPSVNMVNELLALGADASADVNILFDAIRVVGHGLVNPDLVAALVAAGADVQANGGYLSETPLHAVLCIRNPKKAVAVANILITAGTPLDEKTHLHGQRPLDYALHVVQSPDPRVAATLATRNRALAKCLLRGGASTTGLADDLEESPAKTSVDLVIKAGGWKEFALWHKRILVGLVTKCKPMPDDAAGLVVDFYCPSGGS